MSNAPQSGPTGHAEGAHPAPVPTWTDETFDKTGVERPVQQPPTVANFTNRDDLDNRIQNIDVTKVANDRPDDADYDDPYPGGPTKTLGVPGDG